MLDLPDLSLESVNDSRQITVYLLKQYPFHACDLFMLYVCQLHAL